MADQVAVTEGSGKNIRTVDIGGFQHQVVLGADAAGSIVHPVAQVAHDGVDSGAPIKIGLVTIAHGTNPTAVAAADRTNLYANRAGIPFTIGGHPNIICRSNRILDSDGAQTDASLAGAIAGGAKVIITQISIKADKNNSGNVLVKVGFGTANVPTPALAGVNGLIFDEDLGAGEGHQIGNGSGIVAIGGGSLTVGYSYYTIES